MSLFQDPYEPADSRRRRRVGRVFLFIGLLLTAAIVVMPAPYIIERPGSATNTLGEVDSTPIVQIGHTTYPTTGRLNMLTVEAVGSPAQTPTWFELAQAWVDPAQIIIPLSEAFPDNQTESENDQQNALLMNQSEQDAAAAALEGLGYKVGRKLFVTQTFKSTPAYDVLKAGDVIISVDGVAISRVEQVRQLLDNGLGKPVKIVIQRNGDDAPHSMVIRPYNDAGTYRLGIMTGTHYTFPFSVSVSVPGVGGPSAGMMFALAVTDKLTPGSMTGGQNISGTGTIDTDGVVGPIGGIRQKMYAALRAGSKVMLAPAENCDEVVGHVPDGLTVIKVGTLSEAKAALAALAAGKPANKLPQCTK